MSGSGEMFRSDTEFWFALNSKPQTLNLIHEITNLNPKLRTLSSKTKPYTLHPTPYILHPKPNSHFTLDHAP